MIITLEGPDRLSRLEKIVDGCKSLHRDMKDWNHPNFFKGISSRLDFFTVRNVSDVTKASEWFSKQTKLGDSRYIPHIIIIGKE